MGGIEGVFSKLILVTKVVGRVKTKPTFNKLIKETHNQFIEKWGTYYGSLMILLCTSQ